MTIKSFFSYSIIYLLALTIGLYFRLYPLIYYSTSDVSEKATVLVIAKLRQSVSDFIQKNLPDIPDAQKKIMIQEQLNDLIHKEQKNVRDSIEKVSAMLGKNEISQKPAPYLLEVDSYYYYQLTKNIVRTGQIADQRIGSKYLNEFMLAPVGHLEPYTLHPYIGYSIYRVLQFFDPHIDLMYAVGFTPLAVMAITLIPFLFICATLRVNPVVSLVSSAFFLLAPIYITRSVWGWYDNDPYNALFPLLILAALFQGLNQRNYLKRNLLWAFLCAELIVLYAFFWQGWVYILSITFASGAAIVLYNHCVLKKKTGARHLIVFFGAIQMFSFAGISLAFGVQEFFALFAEGLKALKNFIDPQLSLWPVIFITVGELKRASFKDILGLTGGIFYFAVAVLGVISFALRGRNIKASEPLKFIIIIIFFVSTFLITLGAQRFALLCLVPLSLLFALGLQWIYDSVHTRASKSTAFQKNGPLYLNCFLSLLISLLIFIPLRTGLEQTRSLLTPIYNAIWEKSLLNIKDNTPENSIINSWWPPGHFITGIAHRRVTFDGATLNVPQAYWMANVFLSDNEIPSLGILRMLNLSANRAVEYLQGLGWEISSAVELLKKITSMNAVDARNFSKGQLKDDQINALLKLTHACPPPSYLFIYNDLVENNLSLSFVNRWNFKMVEGINRVPEALKNVPKRNSKGFIEFLWSVAGGPWNYSETLSQLANNDGTLLFPHGVTVDLNSMSARILKGKFGEGTPQNIIYQEDNQFVIKPLMGDLNFSVVLMKATDDRYSCQIMDTRLAQSLLMRLYHFHGAGLKYFKFFSDDMDLTGRTRIVVYEIDWRKYYGDRNEDECFK